LLDHIVIMLSLHQILLTSYTLWLFAESTTVNLSSVLLLNDVV